MALKHFGPSLTYPRFKGPIFPTRVPVVLATAGNLTYTPAQLLSGLIIRDPAGGARSDVLPTAALLAAEIPAVEIGAEVEFVLRNNADAAETITVTAGTGGTISGAGQSTTTSTVVQNASRLYRITFTNVTAGSEAYTAYSLVSGTH